MIKLTQILFLVLLSQFASGQENKLLDSIIQITRQNSIYRDCVNWKTLQTKIYDAVDKDSQNEFLAIRPAIGLMLDSLNDNHSFISYNGKNYGRTTKVDLYSRINKETKKAIGWPNPTPISTKRISTQIAYIAVPGFNVNPADFENQVNQLGQALRDSLCHLDPEKLKGIIVDLRLNIGGNMYPMLGGIGPLLDNGKVGSFVNTSYLQNWNIKAGNFYLGEEQVTNIKNNCVPNRKIKVAVLLGPATASSGEALGISFIGQKNVKTFGEKTGGFISAKNEYKIRENLTYYLASAYEVDRKGKIYTQQISPDINIQGGDSFEELEKDKKIEAAIKWIKSKER